MKLYKETDLIDLVQSLKNYTHESHSIIGHDERDAKEFVDIFLKDRTPIEVPSDEDIKKIAIERFPISIEDFGCEKIDGNEYFRSIFIQGIECLRDKIEGCSK